MSHDHTLKNADKFRPPSNSEIKSVIKNTPSATVTYEDLLRQQLVLENAEIDEAPDAFDQLLTSWTDIEFQAALDEALQSPECLSLSYKHGNLPFRIFEAWVRVRPDVALPWINSVHSRELRDGFVATAWYAWPIDHATEGLAYLLKNHTTPEGKFADHLTRRAIEQTAAQGDAAKVARLLADLTKHSIEPSYESISLPRNFAYYQLIPSAEFQALKNSYLKTSIYESWFDNQPDHYLTYLSEHQAWELFPIALRTSSTNSDSQKVIALWESSDEPSRKSMLLQLTREHDQFAKEEQEPDRSMIHLAQQVNNPTLRSEWVDTCLRVDSIRPDQYIALLETIADPMQRLTILHNQHPTFRWKGNEDGNTIKPEHAKALHQAIPRWFVEIPPDAVQENSSETSDPFAP